MRPIFPIAFSLCVACGGTTTQVHVDSGPNFNAVPFRGNTELTPLAEVPTQGTAHYQGQIGFGTNSATRTEDARVVGDLDLDVNFRSNTVTGEADQFVDRLTGERLDGVLYNDMRIRRDAEQTASDALSGFTDGALYRPNGTRIDVELDTYGDFYATQGDRIQGTVEGTAAGLPLTSGAPVTGVFDVRR